VCISRWLYSANTCAICRRDLSSIPATPAVGAPPAAERRTGPPQLRSQRQHVAVAQLPLSPATGTSAPAIFGSPLSGVVPDGSPGAGVHQAADAAALARPGRPGQWP
ncbi:unnamed protein product, partial [Prorocentrum cordatum]